MIGNWHDNQSDSRPRRFRFCMLSDLDLGMSFWVRLHGTDVKLHPPCCNKILHEEHSLAGARPNQGPDNGGDLEELLFDRPASFNGFQLTELQERRAMIADWNKAEI